MTQRDLIAMTTQEKIEALLSGRTQVHWEVASECFKVWRGKGFTYRTLQAWQTMEMFPSVLEGAQRWYDPYAVWAWWIEMFGTAKAG